AERKGVERRVERDEFHGEWNYTIAPQDPDHQLLTRIGVSARPCSRVSRAGSADLLQQGM
ncbi:hypothetical protein ACFVY9_24690, partial [Streptomyces sp. NPDC059544]|uniref:hypothetical protein n=1 Tax=Streptomyces sp. NPDC059544 TaxID=3346861 RepID=UPI00369D13C1